MSLPLTLLVACGTAVPVGALDIALDGVWDTDRGTTSFPLRDPLPALAAQRTIVLPDRWDPDTRAILRGRGVGFRVRALVDGEVVGTDAGGLRPLEIDLTGHLHAGANRLRLNVESPREDNVLLGMSVRALSAYTYNQPRRGEVDVRGELWIEVTEPARFDDLDVGFAAGTLTARAEVTGAEGRTVTFAVVRDGAELARFPGASVRDGVATAEVAWDGPRWQLGGTEAPFLQYLVATLPDGTTRQLRFAAREAARAGRGLTIDGVPTYLAVQRLVTTGAADPRAELARTAALYAQAGLNAIELHAAMHADALLQAADELGFPVVITPRCDGRRQDDGVLPPDAGWAAFVEEGNTRMVEASRDHPSVVLWNIEANGEAAFPTVYTPFGTSDVPAVDLRESQGYSDETYARLLREQRPPAFINELAFREEVWEGRTMLERLSPLVTEHRRYGIGCTFPHRIEAGGRPDERDAVARYTEGLAMLLAREQVPPLPLGPRRGPASIDVTVTRGGAPVPGAVVVLEAPRQAPVASAADRRGVARLTLDYAGEARVGVWGGATQAVTLASGRYTAGQWWPSVATATLELP